MVRTTTPQPPVAGGGSTKRVAAGLLESVTSIWALCAKQAARASRRLAKNSKIVPKAQPKKLLTAISHRAIQLRQRKHAAGLETGIESNGEFGDGGLWQKTILMGDKCQPLDFSGVIYYDSDGKLLDEQPIRSPRASPLPAFAYKSPAI